MARQQRKPTLEAAPPLRRTAIPAPANDNRVRRRALMAGAALVTAAILLFALVRAFG